MILKENRVIIRAFWLKGNFMGKERLRVLDKEKYKKRQKEKKETNRKKQIRRASREKRRFVRKAIEPYYERFRKLKDRHILIVFKDTENMERILLQKHDIGGKAVLLSLPIITEEMITEYLNKSEENMASENSIAPFNNKVIIQDLIESLYGVRANSITDMSSANMIICKDCAVTKQIEDLFPINVRPYSTENYYSNAVATTVRGRRVFSGKSLKNYFCINTNKLGNTYVFQDTLTEIALYKAISGKIEMDRVRADASSLGERKLLGNSLYQLMCVFSDDDIRFQNEEKENSRLEEK